MPITIRWKPHPLASALHATRELARGTPLADERLAAALQPPCGELTRWATTTGVPDDTLWEHLVPLAVRVDSQRMLAETLLVKIRGLDRFSPAMVAELVGLLSAVEAAQRSVLPNLAEELRLRIGPLREQWEARGPGMLANLQNLLAPEVVPDEAEVLLVHPACGGGGEAHVAYNSVRFEAVLANPHVGLPEVARLGWLLGQLQLDLPIFSEGLPRPRVNHLAPLALALPALAAAEEVDLARCDHPTLQLAWTAWRLDRAAPPAFAPTLLDWWRVYRESRPPFRTALSALSSLLP